MIVPAAAAARAIATSPSGCATRWKATGATSTGSATSCPSTVVAVEASATSTRTRGRRCQRRKAATLSASVSSSFGAAREVAERARLEQLGREALVVRRR